MVGQIYVRRGRTSPVYHHAPRALLAQQGIYGRPAGDPVDGASRPSRHADLLCSNPVLPSRDGNGRGNYAYNDGDGSTFYNVEYRSDSRLDPNFHFSA